MLFVLLRPIRGDRTVLSRQPKGGVRRWKRYLSKERISRIEATRARTVTGSVTSRRRRIVGQGLDSQDVLLLAARRPDVRHPAVSSEPRRLFVVRRIQHPGRWGTREVGIVLGYLPTGRFDGIREEVEGWRGGTTLTPA